ncbi:uncharacterized protein DEA37_0010803 [Paragonimus westermani]|uniref:Ig-like domain-containing protein n=1 Tax=Paragonimus westermani TaxID=34504 RepID=A0A5J4NT78_9TREM|nr:uncharacterized protein DEA37_0010803 [Paragonimus westermani]
MPVLLNVKCHRLTDKRPFEDRPHCPFWIVLFAVKPSQPVIVAPSGEPQPSTNGQLIVPVHLSENATTVQNLLRLICQSTGGIPSPSFEWFHNGVFVAPSDSTGMNDLSEADSTNKQYSSHLELNRSALQTGDRLVCLVSNKATLRSRLLSQQKLRSEIFVIIHSAPGTPEIIDWAYRSPNQTNVFDIGTPMEATCRAIPAGNPPGELIWRWERSRAHLNQGRNGMEFSSVSNVIPTDWVIHQYADDRLLSKVRIPHLTVGQHGMDLVCAVQHQVGPEKTSRVSVLVRRKSLINTI